MRHKKLPMIVKALSLALAVALAWDQAARACPDFSVLRPVAAREGRIGANRPGMSEEVASEILAEQHRRRIEHLRQEILDTRRDEKRFSKLSFILGLMTVSMGAVVSLALVIASKFSAHQVLPQLLDSNAPPFYIIVGGALFLTLASAGLWIFFMNKEVSLFFYRDHLVALMRKIEFLRAECATAAEVLKEYRIFDRLEEEEAKAEDEKTKALMEGRKVFEAEGEFHSIDKRTMEDLDIYGLFFEALDRTQTPLGKNRLRWLVSHPLLDPKEIRRRQEAVTELFTQEQLRGDIEKGFFNLSDQGVYSLAESFGTSARPHFLAESRFRGITLLAAVLACGIIAGTGFSLSVGGWIVTLTVLFIVWRIRANAYLRERLIRAQWKHVGNFLREITPFLKTAKSSILTDIQRVFEEAMDPSSPTGLAGFLRRPTPLRARKVYTTQRDELQRLLGAIAELEALFSQAQSDVDNLGYEAFPEILNGAEPCFLMSFGEGAKTLNIIQGHYAGIPFEESVGNSIELYPGHNFMILQGVHTGGKSTTIRMVGQNVIRGQIGSRMRAKGKVKLTPLIPITLINLLDDPERKKSLFDIETDRLLEMILAARKDRRVLLLFDEMFRGTDPGDRLITVQSTAPLLAKDQTLGILATNDLETSKLVTDEEQPGMFVGHFDEVLTPDGSLATDHVLREGPVESLNNIRMLWRKGFPRDMLLEINRRRALLGLSAVSEESFQAMTTAGYRTALSQV